MKNKIPIGRFVIFGAPVIIDGVSGENGDGYTGWTKAGTYLRITVGIDGTWGRCMETIMHEVIEFCMILRCVGYTPLRLLKRVDASMYHYAFNHEQYTEIIQNAADALQYIIPKLEIIWKKRNRRK